MLRIEQDLLQLQLMTVLEIETPMFRKIDRGDRCAKREKDAIYYTLDTIFFA